MTAKPSNRKSSVTQLIQAGKEEAKSVQEIKSVATPKEEIVTQIKVDNEISDPLIEEPAIISQEASKIQEKKGLTMLLTKREVTDSEAVKIPREFHRELKMLSTMSGVTMMQMLGNMIEDFLNENQKEIANYKKKFLK